MVKRYLLIVIFLGAVWLLASCNTSAGDTAAKDPLASAMKSSAPTPAPLATQITPSIQASPGTISSPESANPDVKPTPEMSVPVFGTNAALAAQELIERGRASSSNFSRGAFGTAWKDMDRNGCDTRNDILARDFTTVNFKPNTSNCKVIGGTWTDPYSNESYTFKEQPSGAQIDHVVALKNAWEMGADLWTDQMRQEFANDPLNLLATVASLNQQKSDSNAASWLPPYKPGRCAFIARQTAVKTNWKLFVTSSEKEVMLKILTSAQCAKTLLPR